MQVFVNRVAAALAFGVFVAAPLVAQNAAPACDPTANTRGDIAKAQFSMTRALAASDKGNPTKDLQDVLRLVDNGNDNPTARNYLRGEAYVLYLTQPNTPAVVSRGTLGLTTNPTGTIDLFAAADSSFTIVEKAAPECAALVSQWRQQKPWLNTLNAAIVALNANQLDSAEIFAKRSLLLDRRAPYAYSVLGSIAHNRKDWTAASNYWKQALTAAGTDTTYADVRIKTMYEIASSASDRAEAATGTAKKAAAREAIKPWQDYIAVANNDLLLADALDNVATMYVEAGDSTSVPTIYAPMLANPAKYGEISLVHAGVVATRNGHPGDAATLFNAALTQNPYSRDALNNLAATYIQNKDYGKAFPLIDKLVAMDPSNPDNPLLYAFAYQGMYKGTKDKKLQKMYTDSLIYWNGKSENATVKLAVTEFTRRANETTVGGTIENRGTTPKTYTVSIDLLDKNGAVVDTQTATVGPVAPKSTGTFRVTSTKGGVYGYRYKPLT
ncbi:MAG TPA: FxLYD domain-containing protein [Gemmatimonadaceae bacterium]|jgi:tetratricopeptide (TPR) repeat protein|nr:FxLYD domain-containing protein [Gemmatimonadaceae bacterium]